MKFDPSLNAIRIFWLAEAALCASERVSCFFHGSRIHISSLKGCHLLNNYIRYIIIRVFCPKAGTCAGVLPKAGLPPQTRNQGCSFTRDWIGVVASRCFQHPTLSLASKQTLKDLKISQGHQRGSEESGFG